VPHDIRVRLLPRLGEGEIEALSALLIDCVESGASVGFLLPMTTSKAAGYWRSLAPGVVSGERLVLAALDAPGTLLGTIQVVLKQFENQPHRADVVKMLVHRCARRRGIGAALLAAAEQAAREAGKTVLVLDTAGEEAARLYERHGWQRCGRIPDYALWPDGTACATTIFFKSLR
jgi:ribosomal protein S18 acetylase RimI-like enzyme